MRATAALDGQRAVFAAGSGPDFSIVVIAADGSVVGTARTLTAANDYMNCRALQPTDHAAALSVVEYGSDGEAFHWLELTAAGDVAWEVKVPLYRTRPPDWRPSALPCPQLALTPDGIALLAFETGPDRDAWRLHRIGRDGSTIDEPWETLPELPRSFAIQGSDVFALTVRNDAPPMVVKRSNGQDQQFPIDAQLIHRCGGFEAERHSESCRRREKDLELELASFELLRVCHVVHPRVAGSRLGRGLVNAVIDDARTGGSPESALITLACWHPRGRSPD